MKKATKKLTNDQNQNHPVLDRLLADLSEICEKNSLLLNTIEIKLRTIHKSSTSLSGENISGAINEKEKEPQTKMQEIGNKIMTLQAQSAWLNEIHNHLSEII